MSILAPPFSAPLPFVGMVHLDALPGAPDHRSMKMVLDRAREDALALVEGGVDGIMIENYGDVPFFAGAVPPETIAGLAVAVAAVQEVAATAALGTGADRGGPIPLGVNVLRNDARAALGVAAATGAAFIRVNVHTGTMYTDQGRITGQAAETLRARAALPGSPAILADVFVKHATPPAGTDLAEAARDLVARGGADGVIVSGSGTGEETPLETIRAVRAALPETPIWVGSGVTPESIDHLADLVDGVIVGSSLKAGGQTSGRVDAGRVRTLAAKVAKLRTGRETR